MRPGRRALAVVFALAAGAAWAGDDAESLADAEFRVLRAAQARCDELSRAADDPDVSWRELDHARRLLPPDLSRPPPTDDPGAYSAERADRAHAVSLAEIAAVARRWDAIGGREGFDRLFARCAEVYGTPASARAFGLTWDAARLMWLHPADARRLTEGWERLGGWLSPPEVAALDAAHAAAAQPTEWRDDGRLLRTKRPVHEAVAVLAHARDVRARLRSWFGVADPPRAPVELPLALFDTRAELEAALGPRAHHARFAALYVRTPDVGPVVASREIRLADGTTETPRLDDLLWVLRHEIAHQELHETFRVAGAPFDADAHAWLVEGVATYLAEWETAADGPRLRHVRERRLGTTTVPGPFAWCAGHRDATPDPATIVTWGRSAFEDAAAYRWAATFVAFLMDGGDTARRARFVELVRAVHAGRAPARTLAGAFPDEGPDELRAAFRAFVAAIETEDD